ncbi:MAG: DUF3597 domain-containing protein [Anaerolineales bacterium]|nr:DUF3597 domain-containing protein [Anaerolineales bacterium]
MSIFSKILDKLGMKKEPEAAKAPTSKGIPAAKTPTARGIPSVKPSVAPKPVAARAIPMVDVVGKLEALAAKGGRELNWKVSIVDLLTLLGIDSSLEARKELAVELGCPPENMGDSARMNVWLHKTVMQKLAANGGNIPRELLD